MVDCGLLLEYSIRGRADSVCVVSNNSSTPCSPLLHRGGTRTAVTSPDSRTDGRPHIALLIWPDSRPAVKHASKHALTFPTRSTLCYGRVSLNNPLLGFILRTEIYTATDDDEDKVNRKRVRRSKTSLATKSQTFPHFSF